jgi:hypothetical protein
MAVAAFLAESMGAAFWKLLLVVLPSCILAYEIASLWRVRER